jgi:hypothetical protein
MAQPTIVVYAPDGSPERHTRPNARDLVNGAGYSWMRGVTTTPAAIAPFATPVPPEDGEIAQKVLDKIGGKATNMAPAIAAAATLTTDVPVEEPAEEEVVDFSAPVVTADDEAEEAIAEEEAIEAVEDEADEGAEEAPAAPRRRGRPPRA